MLIYLGTGTLTNCEQPTTKVVEVFHPYNPAANYELAPNSLKQRFNTSFYPKIALFMTETIQ